MTLSPVSEIDALMARAEAGGPHAALAARRVAYLTEGQDPARARRALAIAARLDPLDPGPKLALARLHAEAGDLGAAREQAQGVLAGAIDLAARARAAFILGEIDRAGGDLKAARVSFEATMRIENGLLAGDRDNPTAARWFARARGRIAELDAAEGALAQAHAGAQGALSVLHGCAAQIGEPPALAADIADAELRLGALELDAHETSSARGHFAQAIARYEALVLIEPGESHWRAALADAWALAAEADYARGAPTHAREAMDNALKLRVKLAANDPAEAWALAATWRLRAALLAALGDRSAASQSLAQARALCEARCAGAPDADAPAHFLVHVLLDQADQALHTADLAQARDAAASALERAEDFFRRTGEPSWRGEAAACWDRLGETARAAGHGAGALDGFARAVEFRRAALGAQTQDAARRRALSGALIKYGAAALAARQVLGARTAFEECAKLRLELAREPPRNAARLRDWGIAVEHVGLAAKAMGDSHGARAAWEEELDAARHIFPDASHPEAQRFRAVVEAHLAGLGGLDADAHRASALGRLDQLARDGALGAREAALRKKLWKA